MTTPIFERGGAPTLVAAGWRKNFREPRPLDSWEPPLPRYASGEGRGDIGLRWAI
jgi:hypothetical protein